MNISELRRDLRFTMALLPVSYGMIQVIVEHSDIQILIVMSLLGILLYAVSYIKITTTDLSIQVNWLYGSRIILRQILIHDIESIYVHQIACGTYYYLKLHPQVLGRAFLQGTTDVFVVPPFITHKLTLVRHIIELNPSIALDQTIRDQLQAKES